MAASLETSQCRSPTFWKPTDSLCPARPKSRLESIVGFFLLLRFYVNLILRDLEGAMNFVVLVNYSLQIVQQFIIVNSHNAESLNLLK